MVEVAFVMHRFRTGGVERMFLNIADQMHSHKVRLVILNNDYDSVYNQIPEHVSITDFNDISLIKLLRICKIRYRFLNRITNGLIFTVQCFYCLFFANLKQDTVVNFSDTLSSLLITFALKGKKVSWIHLNPRVLTVSKFARFYKFFYQKCSELICICQAQRKLILHFFPNLNENNVKVVYNTIDIKTIDDSMKVSIDVDCPNYILMVSRLDNRSKDFFTVINAYQKVILNKKAIPRMFIIGDGPDKDEIQRHIDNL
jgi:hypothetical protein